MIPQPLNICKDQIKAKFRNHFKHLVNVSLTFRVLLFFFSPIILKILTSPLPILHSIYVYTGQDCTGKVQFYIKMSCLDVRISRSTFSNKLLQRKYKIIFTNRYLELCVKDCPGHDQCQTLLTSLWDYLTGLCRV